MNIDTIIFSIVSSMAAGLIIYLWQRSKNATLFAENRMLKESVSKQEAIVLENQTLRIKIAENDKIAELQSDRLKWVETAEQKLQETFQALSNSALLQNSRQFIEQAKEQMQSISAGMKSDWGEHKAAFSGIISPVAKELGNLDKQVREMEQKREGAYQGLNSQIENMLKSSNQLQHQTITLSQALKSTGVRAKWGETTLKRLAELSGMVEHVDYTEQATNESGTRPDMIIELPGGGFIPIDAKAPMNAYLESLEAPDEAARIQKSKAHIAAIRQHIKALSSKEYWKQNNSKTAPELTVMLVPYESGLSAAFAEDPTIFDDALTAKVVLCTPATLLALLKVFAVGWNELRLSENAAAIADQGRVLYDRILKFLEHFASVGSRIESTVDAYNKSVGSLESRVLPPLRKIKELGTGQEDPASVKTVDTRTKETKIIEKVD